MKLHLVIFSALLVSAFALPVPDEEVSPVQPLSVPEVKPEIVAKPEEKSVEVAKPELRSATEAEKPIEVPQKKIDLPVSAPDAEVPQTIPEKKLEEPKPELKEAEKKPAAKQILAEDKPVEKEEVKALPVVEPQVAAIEEEKKVIVDEIKPIEIQPEGKSTQIVPAEEPKAEEPKSALPIAEVIKPEVLAVKSELPALAEISAPAAAAVEEKKDDLSGRQERGTEKRDKPTEEVPVEKVVAELPTTSPAVEAVPEVKSLKSEDVAAPAELKPEIIKPATEQSQPDLKASPAAAEETALKPALRSSAEEPAKAAEAPVEAAQEKKLEQPTPATSGDISSQQLSSEEIPKTLKAEEPKQEPAPVAAPIAVASPKQLAEPAALAPAAEQSGKDEIKLAEPEIKKTEEKPIATVEEKSKESSESKESTESKESEESKESKESEESKKKN